MRPFSASLALLLLLLTCGCGGSSSPADAVDEGYSLLSAGSYSDALSSLDAALAGLTPTDEQYREAKVLHVRALCHLDAAKAKSELLGAPKEAGIEARDYSMVVTELVSVATYQAASDTDAVGQTLTEAIAILEAGKTNFPEYDRWDALIEKTGDKVRSLGDVDALDALKGLGYVGGD